jgi:hypothetical protein
MKLHAYPFIIAFIAIAAFASCKKGDAGPQGQPGTANVIYSQWFTASPWKKDTVFSVYGFNYSKAAPEITQQVLDSGTVITYAKLVGYNVLVWPATQVGQLPINLTYQQGTIMTDTWSSFATAGSLRIRFVNDKNYYPSIAATHQFRYIIIPGGQPAGRARTLTYEEVCKKYNIPE